MYGLVLCVCLLMCLCVLFVLYCVLVSSACVSALLLRLSLCYKFKVCVVCLRISVRCCVVCLCVLFVFVGLFCV